MKKLLLLFSVFLLTTSTVFAQQQIYWTEVALEVTPGKASLHMEQQNKVLYFQTQH